MPDLSTLQARLSQAESAYHKLLTGSLGEEVTHADMRVRYTRAQANELAAYIDSLKSQISAAGGAVTGEKRRSLEVDL